MTRSEPLTRFVLATALGAALAAVRVAVTVYPAFPAAPPVWSLLGSMALAMAVGPVFGALPARRAARLEPVAALSGR